jgi:16S rRNA G1207 methylase RsmC
VRELTTRVGLSHVQLSAVEIDRRLSSTLALHHPDAIVRCADFLDCELDDLGFDRIVMNPPFANARDTAHIRHAVRFLKEGGRLWPADPPDAASAAAPTRAGLTLLPIEQPHVAGT